MLRSRVAKMVSIAGALLLVYVAGVMIRERYGIRVAITNETASPLKEVTVMSSERNNVSVGNLVPGKKTRVFVTARTESHIDLQFLDPAGQQHRELVVGYVEGGYCGRVAVRILPDNTVKTDEKIDPVACWGGWFDF